MPERGAGLEKVVRRGARQERDKRGPLQHVRRVFERAEGQVRRGAGPEQPLDLESAELAERRPGDEAKAVRGAGQKGGGSRGAAAGEERPRGCRAGSAEGEAGLHCQVDRGVGRQEPEAQWPG